MRLMQGAAAPSQAISTPVESAPVMFLAAFSTVNRIHFT
jgi:hypothetical protein